MSALNLQIRLAARPQGTPRPEDFQLVESPHAPLAAPAPRIGQHSEAVLADTLGLSSGEIARLIDSGIVGTN